MAFPTWLTGALGHLGDRLADRFHSPRYARVNKLADVCASREADWGGFGALDCEEVEVFAALLAAYGFTDAAAKAIYGHCLDDGIDEPHGYIRFVGGPLPDPEHEWEAAHIFVRRLMGDTTAQPRDEAAKRTHLVRLIAARAAVPGRTSTHVLDRQIVQLRLELGERTDADSRPAATSELTGR